VRLLRQLLARLPAEGGITRRERAGARTTPPGGVRAVAG
jgi:hypothetical protein